MGKAGDESVGRLPDGAKRANRSVISSGPLRRGAAAADRRTRRFMQRRLRQACVPRQALVPSSPPLCVKSALLTRWISAFTLFVFARIRCARRCRQSASQLSGFTPQECTHIHAIRQRVYRRPPSNLAFLGTAPLDDAAESAEKTPSPGGLLQRSTCLPERWAAETRQDWQLRLADLAAAINAGTAPSCCRLMPPPQSRYRKPRFRITGHQVPRLAACRNPCTALSGLLRQPLADRKVDARRSPATASPALHPPYLYQPQPVAVSPPLATTQRFLAYSHDCATAVGRSALSFTILRNSVGMLSRFRPQAGEHPHRSSPFCATSIQYRSSWHRIPLATAGHAST